MQHFLWIGDQRSAQSRFVPQYFSKILDEFSTIIEIGTFTGVFTKWISLNVSEECKIFSYDINPDYREVEQLQNVNFRVGDVLDPAIIYEIKTLIEFGGRTLILCDGGDKETEFKLYSRFLKHNDVIMLHDFEETAEEYLEISKQIGWTTVSESHLPSLSRYLEDLNLKEFLYHDFKKVLWGSFIKKKTRSITLTITTSKRLAIFEKTINSFTERCKDVFAIDKVFHFDDSSNNEDREKMELLIKKSFPESLVRSHYFNSQDLGSKRHCEIIDFVFRLIKQESDFNFHLEDDWLFTKDFDLKESISFMENNSDVAYIGVSQPLREFPENITPVIKGDFWKWYFDEDKEILSNLFLDTKMMKLRNQEGYWCQYINWPYFGFRPGIWNVEKLLSIRKMDCGSEKPFELQFAKILSKKYVSYCRVESVCHHIGEEISAYDLNHSER